MAYTEGMNFKKALADLLGLNTDASIGSCLQRIRQLLDRLATAHAPKIQSAVESKDSLIWSAFFLNLHAFVILPLTVVS